MVCLKSRRASCGNNQAAIASQAGEGGGTSLGKGGLPQPRNEAPKSLYNDAEMSSTSLAQQERQTICDLFVEHGPDAPTLCEGWVSRDLAAHLVVRERRPDSGPGLVWPPLAGYTETVRRAARDRMTWDELIETVRRGPPWLLRPFDGPMNTIEFFIHVEDVRRAQDGWEPRAISPALADALWARVGPGGMTKRVPATIVITSPGRAEKRSGTGPLLTLAADPGDLTMFTAGRQVASKVEIIGDAALAAQVRAAKLGV
jgi:uncharacterized protein (TIGR03085 family)